MQSVSALEEKVCIKWEDENCAGKKNWKKKI